MTSRARQLDQISSDRIAAADHLAKRAAQRRDKADTGDLFQAAESTLSMPSYPERTPEEAELAETLTAEEELRVRRAVARYSMYLPHGCTGRRCRKRGHGAGRDWRDTVLQMLGLAPYEAAQNDSYQWGRAGDSG